MVKLDLQWKDLDKAFDELESELAEVTKGIFNETWNLILAQTPQYYGGLAASWTYTPYRDYFADRSKMIRPTDPSQDNMWGSSYYKIRRKGNPEAIGIANTYSKAADTSFKLGEVYYFTNGVDHGEGSYSLAIEQAAPYQLRPVNRPGKMVARALDRVQSRYGKGVRREQAARLKQVRRGGSAASDT